MLISCAQTQPNQGDNINGISGNDQGKAFERRGASEQSPEVDAATNGSDPHAETHATGFNTGQSRSAREADAARPELTDEELMALPRDARRTRIIEGFVCNKNTYGQSSYIKYRPGGMGLVGNQENESVFRWSVRNDQLCYEGTYFEDSCHNLPKRDMPNERKWLLTAMGRGCL